MQMTWCVSNFLDVEASLPWTCGDRSLWSNVESWVALADR